MFCTYLIIFGGNNLPRYYLGSSSLKRLENGYRGSVSSKKLKSLWKEAVQKTPDLFTYKVLSLHESRTEAIEHEAEMQEVLQVVQDERFANCSIARKNGFFGMDVTGSNHPMFGRKHNPESKRMMSENWDKTNQRRSTASQRMSSIGKINGKINGSLPCPEHVKQKLRELKSGTPLSDEHKKAISLGVTRALANPLTREKLSQKARGRKRSPESIEATAAARRGKKMSEASRIKMREAWQKRKQLKEAI